MLIANVNLLKLLLFIEETMISHLREVTKAEKQVGVTFNKMKPHYNITKFPNADMLYHSILSFIFFIATGL